MNPINSEIINIKRNAAYLDFLKADYMLDIDILMDYICNSEELYLAYDNRLKEKINEMIKSKEELVTQLIRLIAEVNELDHELHIWRKQNENH